MGCGTCVKIVVFIANVIFALLSLALVAVGVVLLLGAPGSIPIAVIVVGAVAVLTSTLGCCGALMSNKYMLFCYSMLLVILMTLKTALAMLILLSQDSIKSTLNTTMLDMFEKNQPEFTQFEETLGCCGTSGPQSYLSIKLPPTCCDDATNCTILNAHRGCIPAADQFVEDFGYGIAGCCIILVAIEFIAVFFGLCLANHVSNKYKTRY